TVIFTGVNREYDGTTAAQVTKSDNRVPNDDLNINYVSATFVDRNVGTAKRVNVAGITVTGADAGNYAFNNGPATTAADITPRNLKVTFTGVDKEYDGTTAAKVT